MVFWNVNKKDLTEMVWSLAKSTYADVLVLNENVVDSNQTLRVLKEKVDNDFFTPKSSPSTEKRFHFFCRNSDLDLTEIHSGERASYRNIRFGPIRTLLALVHGVDMRNYDSASRQEFAHLFAEELKFVKQKERTNRLLLLGDFNMNPYDQGMTLASGLNAMMTRSCAARGSRKHLNETYDLYYNPMWSLLGDNTIGPAGTIYDTSSQGPYGWNMLDQVIFNHSVVDLFNDVEILTNAGNYCLMDTNGRPDRKNASDHFPILVTVNGRKND